MMVMMSEARVTVTVAMVAVVASLLQRRPHDSR